MSLTSSAVLVDLSIGVWTARKLDKRVSEEVDVMKGTTVRAGNYSKNLLAGSVLLDRITKFAGSVRTWHGQQTLPWSDMGTRLLPTRNFMEYKTGINERETEFKRLVGEFIAEYPNLVNSAVMRLGGMCDLSEYPAVDTLTNKFKFAIEFCPLAQAGDFRIDAENDTREELEAQYAKNLQAKEEVAMRELWTEMHEMLSHLSERLTDAKDEDGDVKHKQFRSNIIDNVLDRCSVLTKLNITNDPKLEQARQNLERILCDTHVDTIRESHEARNSVKSKVDEILNKMEW